MTPKKQTIEPATAALIIIGAEVLSGKVADTNGPFLIHALRARGIQVGQIRIIGDHIPTIVEAINALAPLFEHVFTSGGIGPTHDDVTIEAVAKAVGKPLVQHPELLLRMQARHAKKHGETLQAPHLKMTYVPEDSRVHFEPDGFGPIVQWGNITILPGVPQLLQESFARIQHTLLGQPFFSRVLLFNVGESHIAQHLSVVQQAYPNVAIGSYPNFNKTTYRVKVTLDGRDAHAVEACYQSIQQSLPAEWILADE